MRQLGREKLEHITKLGQNFPKWGGGNLIPLGYRFPARCVKALHGQRCGEAKRNLAKTLKIGETFGKFL